MTKYDKFFEAIKSFAIDTKICTSEEFIGANENEILKLESEIDFKFNLGMRVYLKHFGHKIGIQNFDLTRFTLKNILHAEEIAKRHDLKEKITKVNLVDGWDGNPLTNNLEQICFINYFETNYYFTFINQDDENPNLFGWDGDKESYRHRMSITSSLRGQIFTGLKYICDARREKKEEKLANYRLDFYTRTKAINIDGLNWLKIFQKKHIGNNLYVMSQNEFEEEIKLIEEQENRIIELEEYGERFEKFIKKKVA
ncbi:MAG: hypothetical protein R2828_34365 [Saprospiraceae bacterium]